MNGIILLNGQETDPFAANLEVMTSIRGDVLLSNCPKNTFLSCDGSVEACQFYMLRYHRDRMLETARELGWIEACDVLEGRQGLRRFKDVLQTHYASSSENISQSPPQKVHDSGQRFTHGLTWSVATCITESPRPFFHYFNITPSISSLTFIVLPFPYSAVPTPNSHRPPYRSAGVAGIHLSCTYVSIDLFASQNYKPFNL